ncbi:Hypothetical predicted protein [Olea europaea subsp. europaea]|uniref:MaoC-like domain-containing protein n=1 Tax=Olea europaea subsp. europaea TaxID=158383 RepID=A0A8S0PK68_OLEEU|nr:Hypothetical predicted protein [Olea europaea subsp. europaea]
MRNYGKEEDKIVPRRSGHLHRHPLPRIAASMPPRKSSQPPRTPGSATVIFFTHSDPLLSSIATGAWRLKVRRSPTRAAAPPRRVLAPSLEQIVVQRSAKLVVIFGLKGNGASHLLDGDSSPSDANEIIGVWRIGWRYLAAELLVGDDYGWQQRKMIAGMFIEQLLKISGCKVSEIRSLDYTLMKRLLWSSIPNFRFYSSSVQNVLETGHILKQARIFSNFDIIQYSKLTNDSNPLHFDLERAKNAGFADLPVPGMLVASLFPRIIASHFPGAVYVNQTLEFKSPVYSGEEITGEVQALNIIRQMEEKYMVKFTTKCFKAGGIIVIDGESTAVLPSLAMKQT